MKASALKSVKTSATRDVFYFSLERDGPMSHGEARGTPSQAKTLTNGGKDDKCVMNRTVRACFVCSKSPSLSGPPLPAPHSVSANIVSLPDRSIIRRSSGPQAALCLRSGVSIRQMPSTNANSVPWQQLASSSLLLSFCSALPNVATVCSHLPTWISRPGFHSLVKW